MKSFDRLSISALLGFAGLLLVAFAYDKVAVRCQRTATVMVNIAEQSIAGVLNPQDWWPSQQRSFSWNIEEAFCRFPHNDNQ